MKQNDYYLLASIPSADLNFGRFNSYLLLSVVDIVGRQGGESYAIIQSNCLNFNSVLKYDIHTISMSFV